MTYDFKLDPELKKEWLEALRSGKYPHARQVLKRRSVDDNHVTGYCCLGVLQDLRDYDRANEEELLLTEVEASDYDDGDVHPCPIPSWAQNYLAIINDSDREEVHLYDGVPWPTPGCSEGTTAGFTHVIRYIEENL